MQAQRQEPDNAKRTDLWKQTVKYINETPFATALYYGNVYAMWQPYVKDIYTNRGFRGLPLTNTWLAK